MSQVKVLNSSGKDVVCDAELRVPVLELQGSYSTEDLSRFLKDLESVIGRSYVCMSSETRLSHRIYDIAGDGYPLGVFGEAIRRVLHTCCAKNNEQVAAELLIAV